MGHLRKELLTFCFTAKYSTTILANVENYLINIVRISCTELFLYCNAISGLNTLFSFSFLSFSVISCTEIEQYKNYFGICLFFQDLLLWTQKHTEVETVDLVLKLKNKLVCSQKSRRSVKIVSSHLR